MCPLFIFLIKTQWRQVRIFKFSFVGESIITQAREKIDLKMFLAFFHYLILIQGCCPIFYIFIAINFKLVKNKYIRNKLFALHKNFNWINKFHLESEFLFNRWRTDHKNVSSIVNSKSEDPRQKTFTPRTCHLSPR